MEVYVLCGRTYWCEGVYDHDGNYFRESPITEVYQSFDTALKKMKEYAKEAYNWLKKCNYIVDDSFAQKTTEDDLFATYNMDCYDFFEDEEDEDEECEDEECEDEEYENDEDLEEIENDVCWYYDEGEDYAEWQMYAKNIPYGENVPILAGLRIQKVKLNP